MLPQNSPGLDSALRQAGSPPAALEACCTATELGDEDVFRSLRADPNSKTPYSDVTQRRKKGDRIPRPMNAFMVWAQLQRRRIVATNPDMHNASISKGLGQVWRGLDATQKQPFADEANRLLALHRIEFPGYKYRPRKRATGGRISQSSAPGSVRPGRQAIKDDRISFSEEDDDVFEEPASDDEITVATATKVVTSSSGLGARGRSSHITTSVGVTCSDKTVPASRTATRRANDGRKSSTASETGSRFAIRRKAREAGEQAVGGQVQLMIPSPPTGRRASGSPNGTVESPGSPLESATVSLSDIVLPTYESMFTSSSPSSSETTVGGLTTLPEVIPMSSSSSVFERNGFNERRPRVSTVRLPRYSCDDDVIVGLDESMAKCQVDLMNLGPNWAYDLGIVNKQSTLLLADDVSLAATKTVDSMLQFQTRDYSEFVTDDENDWSATTAGCLSTSSTFLPPSSFLLDDQSTLSNCPQLNTLTAANTFETSASTAAATNAEILISYATPEVNELIASSNGSGAYVWVLEDFPAAMSTPASCRLVV